MKRALVTSFATVAMMAILAIGSGTAIAEHHEGGFKVIPVDLSACEYREKKGPKDLDAYVARFNTWADAKGLNDLSVWTLTSYYFGPGDHSDFDFIWMIAGKTAVALGKTHDTWVTDGDGLQKTADEIASCASHSNFTSVNYKPTPAGRTPQDSLLTFSDCNFREGATFEELGTAMAAWASYLGEKGSEAGIFHWYPVYGGGGEKFDFKWLEVHSSFEAMGGDYEIFGNGRGWEKHGELLGPLVSCDAARVYQAKSRRFTQLR
ncbi:MAG: hypothetical protein WBM68_10580 [Woeseia sp.]